MKKKDPRLEECLFCGEIKERQVVIGYDVYTCCTDAACVTKLGPHLKEKGFLPDLVPLYQLLVQYYGMYRFGNKIPELLTSAADKDYAEMCWPQEAILIIDNGIFTLSFYEEPSTSVSWPLAEPDSLDRDLCQVVAQLKKNAQHFNKFLKQKLKQVSGLLERINKQSQEKFGGTIFEEISTNETIDADYFWNENSIVLDFDDSLIHLDSAAHKHIKVEKV